jgi:4-hydroxy-tetrahydrodipicolinate reductase
MTKGLAIVGNGKMGKLVETLAPSFDFEVRARFAAHNNAHAVGLTREALRHVDVAIEFSTPQSAPENLLRLASLGVPTVTGTTGWYDQLPAVRDAFLERNTSLVWAPNFSIGMNIFMQVVAQAAALFAKQPDYDAWGWEIHHAAKKDALSGSLKKLADEIHAAGYSRSVNLSANRAGAHPGTHEIGFDSADDTVTLRHSARGREGFARGALRAAAWTGGKKGVYEFREILGELS